MREEPYQITNGKRSQQKETTIAFLQYYLDLRNRKFAGSLYILLQRRHFYSENYYYLIEVIFLLHNLNSCLCDGCPQVSYSDRHPPKDCLTYVSPLPHFLSDLLKGAY